MTEERYGGWIQTYTGVAFYPLDPRPEEIRVQDIAHALALICRFGGHTKSHYSVAQHSVLVSQLCPAFALEALLHDAAEAYLGDLVRPLKRMEEFAFYCQAEKALERMIAEKFDAVFPWPQAVKDADDLALAIEKRDLLRQEPQPWMALPSPIGHTRLFPNSSGFIEMVYREALENEIEKRTVQNARPA